MRIVAAGVSGFIGSRLTVALKDAGHQVVQLVRRPADAPDEVRWDPDADELDVEVLDGADAVINLCGVGAGDKRWNDHYRRLIVTSRVRPTALLAKAAADRNVPVLLNASAIGYYGHRDDTPLDETGAAGSNFMAGVCRDWEAATAPADAGGVRVVNLRTGLVLGAEGGLLAKLVLITKLFAGGRLGSGRQYWSWISAQDEVDAILFLLTAELAGPVNLTAPLPVTNAAFTGELGRQLRRPTPWVVPSFALHAVVGGFADEIVEGQRVLPKKLEQAGFRFSHATLPDALRAELGK